MGLHRTPPSKRCQLSTLPINENEEFLIGLEEQINKTARTFSLNNKKQETNIIDSIKIACRKYTKEKTGKKPVTNINLIRT